MWDIGTTNEYLISSETNDDDDNRLDGLHGIFGWPGLDRMPGLDEWTGLDGFAGCAVVVSHDRWFLDRIATHILAFEGDSQVYFFEGGYSEYEENKKQRLGNVEPKRFKYRKLME